LTKVIYITGSGRSGSTLLNALLGSVDPVFGVGELARLPQSGWIDGEYCACGLTVNRCLVWAEIREAWCRKTGSDVHDLVAVQGSVERSRYLHRPLFCAGGTQFKKYARLVGTLYDVIAEVSGAGTIIDTSKNPIRAMALARVPTIDLRLIHLVRDVRGVAWSLMKRFAKDARSGVHQSIAGQSPLGSIAHWTLVNLLAEWAMSAMPHESRMRLRYEDLISQPASILDDLGQVADIEVRGAVAKIDSSATITFGHMVAGNRVRMSPGESINPDLEWRQIMDASVQRKLWIAAWPLMRRYGYALR